ncbi:MAG: fibrobacter succinogenes major paralogous domain-containing protein [Mediterranea sp.]|jgi:hypothetical protein|nr:fibrobacter succinogenes major paralogous domain-containing protein [Mediterranea sp.]
MQQRLVLLWISVFCLVCSYANANNGPVVQPSSNCYIVAPDGAPIAIPVSRANEFDASAIEADAVFGVELVWADVDAGNGAGLGADGCIAALETSGLGCNGHIIVYPGRREGNAVVAVTVGAGTDRIKWSWHIWVTSYDPGNNPKVYTNANAVTYTFMDRNLGAVHSGGSNLRWGTPESLGLHYQWGRKDPFPASASVTSDMEKTVYTAGGATTVNAGKTDNGGGGVSVATAVRNPSVFYYCYTHSYVDWCSVTTDSDTRWGNTPYVKSLYDPCPAGWRVPGQNAWTGHTTDNFAYNDTPAGRYHEQTGWYPASGLRGNNDGSLHYVAMFNYYWSATPSGNSGGGHLYFDSRSVYLTGHATSRTYGYSVRCVAE